MEPCGEFSNTALTMDSTQFTMDLRITGVLTVAQVALMNQIIADIAAQNDLSEAQVKAQVDQALTDADVATTANQTAIASAIAALENLSQADVVAALGTYGSATTADLAAVETSLLAALTLIEGKVDVVDSIVDDIDLTGAKQALSLAIQDAINDVDLELDGLATSSALAAVASKVDEVWKIHGLDPANILAVTKTQRAVGPIMQEISGDCVNTTVIERTA